MLTKPESLLYLEALSKRLPHNSTLREELVAGRKGYESEMEMYRHLLRKKMPAIILYDVLLKKSSTVQIDFIVITTEKIYLLEVKNFEGIFYHKDDDFFKRSYKMERNPLNRSKNAYNVLDAILRTNRIRIPLERKIIFMNYNMALYGHDVKYPILLRPELEEYLDEMALKAKRLSDYHYRIARLIKSSRPKTNLYKTEYEFDYQKLEKSMWCSDCLNIKMLNKHRYLVCTQCQKIEGKATGVNRSIEEFNILFPGDKLTASILKDWCGDLISNPVAKKAIERRKIQRFES